MPVQDRHQEQEDCPGYPRGHAGSAARSRGHSEAAQDGRFILILIAKSLIRGRVVGAAAGADPEAFIFPIVIIELVMPFMIKGHLRVFCLWVIALVLVYLAE